MPGYEPFLLCDFHVHTQWSDGKLTVGEVVDLYGSTGKFDVIAITDHILMKKDLLARAGRIATLGRRRSACARSDFDAYLADIDAEARAGAQAIRHAGDSGCRDDAEPPSRREELPRHRARHQGVHQRRSDAPTRFCARSAGRARSASPAIPHHRTTRRIEISTCYLWDHREELSELVDVWEAANRDDLFSVTSLKHYPYVANSDFHKPKHLYSWKTLLRCEKNWPAIRQALRSNVDVALTLFRNGSWAA